MSEEVKLLNESQEAISAGISTTASNNMGGSSSNGSVGTAASSIGSSKRKYGSNKGAQEVKTLLVTKDKKIRHSQACDRCRLKKIKCDGLKPTCSQCLKVNYKCSTSDRLTRRGFPRGYTEMLEKEVVRLQRIVSSRDTGGGIESGVNGREGKKGHDENPMASSTKGDSEAGPQFPFINDTFHYYNNYLCGENFLGHCTWNVLLNQNVETSLKFDENWLNEYQISMLVNTFQLDPKNSFIPKFLIFKYKHDLKKIRKLISKSISHFNKFQNSLIPLLYPYDVWKEKLSNILSTTGIIPDSLYVLALVYIIQLNWSCFDESKIFQLTKVICGSRSTNLKQLQLLLMGSYYFMGGLTNLKPVSINANKVWSTELLHQSFTKILDLGLYVNSNRLVSTNNGMEDSGMSSVNQGSRLITFWSFQFLDSLWSLVQGTPKLNFLIDEFHPQSINSLSDSMNISFLKPFTLLLSLFVDSFDGCNLIYTLSDNNNNGKSQIIYATESFRKILKKLKLYHHLQDHEDEIDNNFTSYSISLTKPDIVEIQLTLFYLITSFLTASTSNETRDEKLRSASDTDIEDTAFEILSLYYLLMIDDSHMTHPRQLTIMHILPCNNHEIILSCINRLNNWVLQDNDRLNDQRDWKFNKYKNLLTQWCKYFFLDDLDNPVVQQSINHYNIILEDDAGAALLNNWNKVEYLNKVNEFISLNDSHKRSNLIRSSSNATMDFNQFDMFSHPDSLKQSFGDGIGQENNIIDMSAFKSQIIIPNEEESDDGYAEDDDEDDEENESNIYDDDPSKPLEIPFRTKRAGSLFQNKHDLPPLYRQDQKLQDQNDVKDNNGRKRRTLDHIILGNRSFVSQENGPPTKIRHEESTVTKPFNSYNSYSLMQPTKKSRNTSDNTSNNSQGLILPPPPPPNDGSLMFGNKNSLSLGAEAPKNAPQIVETPRAFVDMLLLRQPSQTSILPKRSTSKAQLTNASNIFEE